MTAFKIVEALARFVTRAYEREAIRLAKVAEKVDAEREHLQEEIDELSQQLHAELEKVKAKYHGKQAELGQVLEQHDAALDGHVAAAAAAATKAQQVKEVLR